MAEKVSKAQVHRKIERMQIAGMDVALDGAYGKYKVVNRKETRNLSGRMRTSETLYWLDAYEQGWEAGRGYRWDHGAPDSTGAAAGERPQP